MILEHLVVGPLQVNCFILGCEQTRQAIVIDPGGHPQAIRGMLERHNLTLVAIVATHAHFDHVLGVDALREGESIPFYLHPDDEPVLARQREVTRAWMGFDPGPMPRVDAHLVPGESLQFGEIRLDIAHTPGHSPGSVTLIDHARHQAFTGDLIFYEGVGRTDFPGGDFDVLVASIHRVIFTLPDEYRLLPGHGPFTTVAHEKLYNPFVGRLMG